MVVELPPRYQPAQVEGKWYRFWREHGYFTPRFDPSRPVFSVVLPPPNVTGVLHVGHALNHTWQDILVRYHRMLGDNTLWLPGSDHAGIHTQMKVDELVRSQGGSRQAMGRERFVQAVWQWKADYGGEILRQLTLLGDSVDWSRLRFTLDADLSQAVTEAFVRLYQQGLIYRGEYITNWCVSCRTALSDIEVEHVEQPGQLTYIRYPLSDGSGSLTVATTRPETLLGDSAVAVHPDDVRYANLIGQIVTLPLLGRQIPVVADRAVERGFGTGVVKVTPAHDPLDFAIGQRHHLDSIRVIAEDGTMTAAAGRYQGLDRDLARQRVLADLAAQGSLERQESIMHAVGHCEKCHQVIEPLVSRQWFVRMKPLAGPALAAVDRGLIHFAPARFEKIYRNWVVNIHDWCISRQIWWGHRIPAYYCACGQVVVAAVEPDACPACQGPLTQDPDVLDTWFSSALWPFSTLGWPNSEEEMQRYYPTSVLCTGHDIIFFWVARMIMEGLHFTAQPPFSTVLINGLVRDQEGRKMSKSLGNGVDPVVMIERYGADALRMALVLGSAPGNDIRFSETKVESAMHFANKVYNAIRFVLMNQSEDSQPPPTDPHPADRWIRARLHHSLRQVTQAIDQFEFGEAARSVYDFFWDDFCDWYIELAKVRLNGSEPGAKAATRATLTEVAEIALVLLHPFMPFVSEELWQALPHRGETIVLRRWPTAKDDAGPELTADLDVVERTMDAVRTLRNLRAELNLAPSQPIRVDLYADDDPALRAWRRMAPEIAALSKASALNIRLKPQGERPRQAISGVTQGGIAFVPLQGVVDLGRERERLTKSMEGTQRELDESDRRLANANFIQRAPADVVQAAQRRRGELQARLARLTERLEDLQ